MSTRCRSPLPSKQGLRARGLAVIDIGVCDTPQNYFGTGHLGASGGIQVTASHNPAVYNGLKMSRRDAIPVSWETGIDELESWSKSSDVATDLPPKADAEERSRLCGIHRTCPRRVTGSEPRLKVAADAANGMAGTYLPMLERLNMELDPLYFELDGSFPNHEANPLKPENLVDSRRPVPITDVTWESPSMAMPTARFCRREATSYRPTR